MFSNTLSRNIAFSEKTASLNIILKKEFSSFSSFLISINLEVFSSKPFNCIAVSSIYFLNAYAYSLYSRSFLIYSPNSTLEKSASPSKTALSKLTLFFLT